MNTHLCHCTHSTNDCHGNWDKWNSFQSNNTQIPYNQSCNPQLYILSSVKKSWHSIHSQDLTSTSQSSPSRYEHPTSELHHGKINIHTAESHIYPSKRPQKRNTSAMQTQLPNQFSLRHVCNLPQHHVPYSHQKFTKSSDATSPSANLLHTGVHQVSQL
jgi:hypothetical protein